MYPEAVTAPPAGAAKVVREFYEALARGQMVDALNLFATDAVLTDETGHEMRGIREIAASLLEYRQPRGLSLDSVEDHGNDVLASYRTRNAAHFRGVVSIQGGRIRTVRVERSR